MNIKEFYRINDSRLYFTREQGSSFAKDVAGDFNPIHDVDSKRFCVPGDLMFAAIIDHYGLRERMIFNFSGMVGDNVALVLPDCDAEHLAILDEKDKKYLAIECNGLVTTNPPLIESLIEGYVAFSGQAFPHILVPLMADEDVMINPERPLIIYESMSFELDTLDIDEVVFQMTSKSLNIEGKRGNVILEYDILSNDKAVGHGCKRMVLSGLRPYDKPAMDKLVSDFNSRKRAGGWL